MTNPTKQTSTQRGTGSGSEEASAKVTVIKKYANRRLYNTVTSSYVTLDHLCRMVKDGDDFVVYDARTEADITRSVLTQIIVEEESKGQNLLPIGFLRQLISLYGDSLQIVVPQYLDQVMTTFVENQDATRSRMQEAFGGLFPLKQFEEMGKQNMAMFERAMSLFSPLGHGFGPDGGTGPDDTAGPVAPRDVDTRPEELSEALNAIQDQVDLLQKQLQAMTDQKSDIGG